LCVGCVCTDCSVTSVEIPCAGLTPMFLFAESYSHGAAAGLPMVVAKAGDRWTAGAHRHAMPSELLFIEICVQTPAPSREGEDVRDGHATV
jgi:hypothetical protein